jgi:DNA-binding response OmpR family regulator
MNAMRSPETEALIVLAEFEEPGQLAGPLVQAGFRTEIVDTGDAALRFCGINHVDVVITRIVFRYGITGVELVNRLRGMGSSARAIMITSHKSDRLRKVAGFPMPGVPILRKPILGSELVQKVASVMS